MFLITGYLGDKSYDDDSITTKELIDAFGIDKQLEKAKETVVFDIGSIYKAERSVRGQVRSQTASAVTIPNTFSTKWKGSVVQITYYERKQTKKIGGQNQVEYLPRKTFFSGEVLALQKEKNLEKIVFLMIHPSNLESPLYQPGKIHHLSTRKEQEIALTSVAFQKIELKFKTEILSDDHVEEMLLRAESLKFGNLDKYTADEVRNLILNRYDKIKASARSLQDQQKAAKQFIEKYYEHVSEVRGTIIKAKRLGVLYGYVNGSTGKYVWQWANVSADSGLKDTIILEVPKGRNPEESLYIHASSNIETFYPTVKHQVSEQEAAATVAETKKTPPKGKK